MQRRQSSYQTNSTLLYNDIPQYAPVNPTSTNKYQIPTFNEYSQPSSEEITFLNNLIERIFNGKINETKLFWLLRWIGVDCPFDNNSTCKERNDFIMKIKDIDPDALNFLFETSETIAKKIQNKFGNQDGVVFLLSRKVPGDINIVKYSNGNVKIKVAKIKEVLDLYENMFDMKKPKSTKQEIIYLEPGEFTKINNRLREEREEAKVRAKPLPVPPRKVYP
jgi:hypothetical protein